MDAKTKERPILFNGEMVRAILDGRKTQTRRIIKPQPQPGPFPDGVGGEDSLWWDRRPAHGWIGSSVKNMLMLMPGKCPYGKPGDELWVRETWAVPPTLNGVRPRDIIPPKEMRGGVVALPNYKAEYSSYDPWNNTKWRPSIHMPRWVSRIQELITGIRVEIVGDISEADAIAEGFASIAEFLDCFVELNAKRLRLTREQVLSLWVWVVEFEVKK